MSLFGNYTITVKRQAIGNYDTDDGSYDPGVAEADFTVVSSWQPAMGADQKSLPEGKRSSSVYKLYPNTELRVADPEEQVIADHVVSPLDGKEYEIFQAGANQNNLIPHYKYLAVRVKEAG